MSFRQVVAFPASQEEAVIPILSAATPVMKVSAWKGPTAEPACELSPSGLPVTLGRTELEGLPSGT